MYFNAIHPVNGSYYDEDKKQYTAKLEIEFAPFPAEKSDENLNKFLDDIMIKIYSIMKCSCPDFWTQPDIDHWTERRLADNKTHDEKQERENAASKQ